MKKLALALSEAAATDIVEQADWYTEQSGPALARRWEKAVTSTLLRVLNHPRSGALCRFAHSDLTDVRRVLIAGFPRHLIFYQICGSEILVLRVLHSARDLESLFEAL